MALRNRTKTEILLAVGILILFFARVLGKRTESVGILPFLIGIVGGSVFTYACMRYVEEKGYSKWLGLLSLLACVGFAILVLLPDRNADKPGHEA